jgi:hypothetical protein
MRVLVCLDPVPAADGSCQSMAWVEQPSITDYLPSPEEGAAIGVTYAFTLITLAAVLRFFQPPKENT